VTHNDTPRILIVRLSAIGDTVLNMPVLCALRDRFPRATIGWIVKKNWAPLLEGHCDLDHLIKVPGGWLRSPRLVWQTARRLREIGFDIALDLQGLAKSAIAAWLSGAKRRLGFTHGQFEGREFSPWLNTELIQPTAQHVVERHLELLRPLGIERPAIQFRLPRHEQSDATVARFIRDRGLGAGFAVINAGAGWPSKLWPAERYGEVARHLGRRRVLPTIVSWAGKAELEMAQEIVLRSAGQAQLAPRTSLTELASLARRAQVFIASDTGPLHIAAAVGTPCVGLYGPMPVERCRPYGKQHIALQRAAPTGKLRSRRRFSNAGMLAIGIDDVCQACDTILIRCRTSRTSTSERPRLARAA
jgi:lipopolysaccharide heptosyltransferase I